MIFGIKYITIMLNVKKYRKEFPVTESYIYLDHAGVAPIPLRVKDTVQSFLTEYSEQGVFAYEKWMDRVEDVRGDFSFIISDACIVPTKPGKIPNTPPSAQLGTKPGGGGSG